MIPENATHITKEDGLTTYYHIIMDGEDPLAILVWCEVNQAWCESAYESLEDFEMDGMELIEL